MENEEIENEIRFKVKGYRENKFVEMEKFQFASCVFIKFNKNLIVFA